MEREPRPGRRHRGGDPAPRPGGVEPDGVHGRGGMLAAMLYNTVKEVDEDDDGRDRGLCYVRWYRGPKGGVVLCNSFRAPERCRRTHLSWRKVGVLAFGLLVMIVLAGIFGPPRKPPLPPPPAPVLPTGVAVVLQLKGVDYSTVVEKQLAIGWAMGNLTKQAGSGGIVFNIVVPTGGITSPDVTTTTLAPGCGSPSQQGRRAWVSRAARRT